MPFQPYKTSADDTYRITDLQRQRFHEDFRLILPEHKLEAFHLLIGNHRQRMTVIGISLTCTVHHKPFNEGKCHHLLALKLRKTNEQKVGQHNTLTKFPASVLPHANHLLYRKIHFISHTFQPAGSRLLLIVSYESDKPVPYSRLRTSNTSIYLPQLILHSHKDKICVQRYELIMRNRNK